MVDLGFGSGKKGGGLFGNSKIPVKKEDDSSTFLSQEVSTLSTRLRVLEERSSNIKKKLHIIEEDVLSHRKKYHNEVSVLKDELDEQRKVISEIKNNIIMIVREIRLLAKKEDVDLMKKYLEIWEPLNFVTQNQVEKIIEEIIEEKLSKQ